MALYIVTIETFRVFTVVMFISWYRTFRVDFLPLLLFLVAAASSSSFSFTSSSYSHCLPHKMIFRVLFCACACLSNIKTYNTFQMRTRQSSRWVVVCGSEFNTNLWHMHAINIPVSHQLVLGKSIDFSHMNILV